MTTHFLDIDLSGPLSLIDKVGAKKANVYKLKIVEGEDQWEQFLPTPIIRGVTQDEILESGGTLSRDSLVMENIQARIYQNSDLVTANSQGIKTYWVLRGPLQPISAFLTHKITRKNFAFWEVLLVKYNPLNSDRLETSFTEATNGQANTPTGS